MKININISTQPETIYTGDKTVCLNKEDEKIIPQNVILTLNDFNYKGSLQPLADMVMEWIKEKNK